MKYGQTFGELSLIYGTPRTSTVIAVTNLILIRLEKSSFDKNVHNLFEDQVKDLLEFLKICPIFHNISREILLKLAIRTDSKKFITDKEIIGKRNKSENLYIIRRGTVKVLIFLFIFFYFYNLLFKKRLSKIYFL